MTRDDIIRMAREAGLLTEDEVWVSPHQEAMERFAALVAAAEHEACAKVCDELDAMNWSDFGEYKSGYGEVIRARGQDLMPLSGTGSAHPATMTATKAESVQHDKCALSDIGRIGEHMINCRVRLLVPDHDKEPMKTFMDCPSVHGEHLAYHGCYGTVLCGAGNGGVWVRFDGQGPYQYVGVPIAWLVREEECRKINDKEPIVSGQKT